MYVSAEYRPLPVATDTSALADALGPLKNGELPGIALHDAGSSLLSLLTRELAQPLKGEHLYPQPGKNNQPEITSCSLAWDTNDRRLGESVDPGLQLRKQHSANSVSALGALLITDGRGQASFFKLAKSFAAGQPQELPPRTGPLSRRNQINPRVLQPKGWQTDFQQGTLFLFGAEGANALAYDLQPYSRTLTVLGARLVHLPQGLEQA